METETLSLVAYVVPCKTPTATASTTPAAVVTTTSVAPVLPGQGLGSLPVTGAKLVGFYTVGAGLLGLGTVLMVLALRWRRNRELEAGLES